MPELISLLMPHFDYTKPVIKQEAKQEPGSKTKIEAKKEQVKKEAKKEQGAVKQEAGSSSSSGTKTKLEQIFDSARAKKQLKSEPSMPPSQVANVQKSATAEALGTALPQFS